MRFSRAKPTGSFRVYYPNTRRVAAHADTLREARTDAEFWKQQTPNSIEIQERFPSGKGVTV
jgi:predicted RNase H-like HicB family nuclease